MIDGILSSGNISPLDALQNTRVQKMERLHAQADVRKAAVEYESYFLSYLMKSMRATVPKSALTENPMGDTFLSFYDEEIAKRAAKSGGLGFADFILSTLAQEPGSPSPGHSTESKNETLTR